MWSEFRAFLVKSNALALALAFILGLALATVVNSLVKDIIMPPVGLALGKVDFQNLFIDLSGKGYPSLKAAQDAGAATINYGVFITTLITFVIVAFVVRSYTLFDAVTAAVTVAGVMLAVVVAVVEAST